jgi:hypothetical protein
MLLRLYRNSKEFFEFLLEEIGDFFTLDYGHYKKRTSDNSFNTEQSLTGETTPELEFD